jgi:hypothetical protein
MKMKRLPYALAAVLCLAIGAMAGISGGLAAGTKAHSSSSSSEQKPGPPAGGPMGGPPVHSVSVVPNKEGSGFDTVTMDGGTVQSVSGQQLTITEGTKTLTYKTVTLAIAANATVTRDGKSAQLSQLQAGDHVIVCENSDGTSMVNAADSSFTPPHGPGGPGGPPGAPGQGIPPAQG